MRHSPDVDMKRRKLKLLFHGYRWNALKARHDRFHGMPPALEAGSDGAQESTRSKPLADMTFKRWVSGEVIPMKHNPFFVHIGLYDYLDGPPDPTRLIAWAHEIRTTHLGPLDKSEAEALHAALSAHGASLFARDHERYAPIATMKSPTLPYYQERFRPDFLEAHLDILAQVIGEAQAGEIRGRLLCEQGHQFPAVDLLPGGALPSLDESLDDTRSQIAPPPAFIEAVRAAGSEIDDKTTFALDSLDLATGSIRCFTSSYFRAIFECDKHYYQIAARFPGLRGDLDAYAQSASLHDWALALKRIVLDNDFGAAEISLGCSCLIVHNTDDGYQALLCKKSHAANGMHDLHVIPAMMFQPIGNNPLYYDRELNVRWQVYRELAEELFNLPEFDASVHPGHLYRRILDRPEISHLETLLDNGGAEFHVTGLSLDLFRLRPEILTTLVIHDKEWYTRHMPQDRVLGNWEVTACGVLAMDTSEATYRSVLQGRAGYLCAPGIAAYVRGMRKFREVMAQR